MTSTYEERLRAILKSGLTPLLRTHAFQKAGLNYRSVKDDLTWLLNVQKSRWNSADEAQFTINGGVYIPAVVSRYSRAEPNRPTIADCCISARIGMLTDSRIDEWWTLTRTNYARDQEMAVAISDEVATVLLPFMMRFQTRNDVAAFLAAPITPDNKPIAPRTIAQRQAYAALIYEGQGQRTNARRAIEHAVRAAQGTPIEGIVESLHRRLSAAPTVS